MVIDFGDIKEIVNEYIVKEADHTIFFNGNSPHKALAEKLQAEGHRVVLLPYQPTSEMLIVDFAQRLQKHLPAHIALHSLRLQETESSYAEWYASDNL